MTLVKCYQKCNRRSEEGFCTKGSITLDTRGACLYFEAADNSKSANTLDLDDNGSGVHRLRKQ